MHIVPEARSAARCHPTPVRSILAGSIVALLCWEAVASAADPATKCEAGKLRESQKYASCRLKAETKAVLTGSSADYTKCREKLQKKWASIEEKAGAPGICPTEGDRADMESRIDVDTLDIATLLAGGTPVECGNAVLEPGEDCDFGDPGAGDCVGLGFISGPIACGAGCLYDTSGCVAGATPDATSDMSCDVSVLDVAGTANCTLDARVAASPVVVNSAVFSLAASPDVGTLSAISPTVGSSFSFTYTAAVTTGVFEISNGVTAPINLTVVDTPDATSDLACVPSILTFGEVADCTITPRSASVQIFASATDFSVAAAPPVGVLGALAPLVGDSFSFTYTAPLVDGPVTISDGVSPGTNLTIVDTPDATSSLSCSPDTVTVGQPSNCTISARKLGAAVVTAASVFTLSASPDEGSFGALSPEVGSSFSFVYTASGSPGMFSIQDGVSSGTTLTVTN